MHVGLCCSHDFSPAFGVSRVVRGIERSLLHTRTDAKLTFYGLSPEAERALGSCTQRDVRLRRGRGALSWGSYRVLWEQAVLPRRCQVDGIDLLHVPSYTAPLLGRTPVVVTIHDVLSTTHPELCRARNAAHHRLVIPRTLRKARRVFTVSEHVRRELHRQFELPLERTETIHPGVDSEFFEPVSAETRARVRAQLNLPERYLLWVGNREPKKNLVRLREAIRLLRQSGIRAPFVMTGYGSADESRALGIHDVGWVTSQDLPALYRGAQALVFPSLAEGWGLPVAEALVSGVPVVASKVPSALELDPSAVLSVRADSSESIARAIAQLLGDPSMQRELAARGRRATTQLTWERHAERLWSGYARALETGDSSAV